MAAWSYAVLVISVVAAGSDLARGRIPNWLTAPAFVLGVIAAFAWGGAAAGGDALLGGAAGLALFGWMFRIGILGGGDVKLLMAIGAWGGLRYCTGVALLSVLLGGSLALVLLLVKGRLRSLLVRLRRFITSLVVPELEVETLQVDRGMTMPFGLPIAVAAIWSAFGHPLAALGLGFLAKGGA